MTLRAAVLGTGFIAAMHTEASALTGGAVTMTGVASRDPERAQQFAARHHLARATADWVTLVTDPEVDLVVVATPNALHEEQTLAALAAGKHVLVEKPMALTTAQARHMIEAARRAERTLAVGHMWRYHPDVVALRGRIERGELGRVVRTHGWGVHARWGPSGWFTDPALAGGGALIDMGIHAIDTARYLVGDPEPARVEASVGVGAFRDEAVDDDGVVLVEWTNGVRSVVEFGWWQPTLGGLEADTLVLGTEGAARVWPESLPPAEDYVHCTPPLYAAQLVDVADACATGRAPIASAEVGLVALAVVERAYHAAGISYAATDASPPTPP